MFFLNQLQGDKETSTDSSLMHEIGCACSHCTSGGGHSHQSPLLAAPPSNARTQSVDPNAILTGPLTSTPSGSVTNLPISGQFSNAESYAASGNSLIDGVLNNSWNKWSDRNLSYGIINPGDDRDDLALREWSSEEIKGIHYALNTVSQFTNLTFNLWEGAAGQSESKLDATLNFRQWTGLTRGGSAFPPGFGRGHGRVSIGEQLGAPTFGSFSLLTYIHEVGHALGLKHGHDGGVEPGPGVDSRTTNIKIPEEINGWDYSVMTYSQVPGAASFSNGGFTGNSNKLPTDYGIVDIGALQYLYGANYQFNANDTVYSFDNETGERFVNGIGDGVSNNNILRTFWDGGGTDTYDFSNFSSNNSIDLTPGRGVVLGTDNRSAHSFAVYARDNGSGGREEVYYDYNIYNPFIHQNDPRSLIENANGGSGNDDINGNQANNVLRGNAGNDRLNGQSGDDILSGGSGTDTAYYSNRLADYRIFKEGSDRLIIEGPDGRDTVYNDVENIVFTGDRTYSFGELFGRAQTPPPVQTPLVTNPANGNTYQLTSGAMSWTEAQAEARRLGGNLVTINNAAEEQWLQQAFGTSEQFWIGLNDEAREGQFEWVSGEAVTYTNWTPGEPNDFKFGDAVPSGEDYALMNSNNRWNDAPNTEIGLFQGVIEIPSANPPVTATPVINKSNGNTYQLTSGAMSWTEAQAEARRLGGNLVTINNAAEEQFLQQSFGTSEQFWIGLNDAATEGRFEWASGEVVTYTNWTPGEPNDFKFGGAVPGGEDYALMNNNANNQWNDLPNSEGGVFQGIIEIPSANPPSVNPTVVTPPVVTPTVTSPSNGPKQQVSVGSDRTVWSVNLEDNLQQRSGASWQNLPGVLESVSVASNSNAWGVNQYGQIWRWNGSSWSQVTRTGLNARVNEVSVGEDGTAWALGTDDSIWQWDSANNDWDSITGRLDSVSVVGESNVWGSNSAGNIYQWNGDFWREMSKAGITATVNEVDAAADGTVWALGVDDSIWQRSGDSWSRIPGALEQVSVGSANDVWGVNSNGDMYQWNGSQWSFVES